MKSIQFRTAKELEALKLKVKGRGAKSTKMARMQNRAEHANVINAKNANLYHNANFESLDDIIKHQRKQTRRNKRAQFKAKRKGL